MIELLICEKCGLAHPLYCHRIVCQDKFCNGKLKLHRISEESEESEESEGEEEKQS